MTALRPRGRSPTHAPMPLPRRRGAAGPRQPVPASEGLCGPSPRPTLREPAAAPWGQEVGSHTASPGLPPHSEGPGSALHSSSVSLPRQGGLPALGVPQLQQPEPRAAGALCAGPAPRAGSWLPGGGREYRRAPAQEAGHAGVPPFMQEKGKLGRWYFPQGPRFWDPLKAL